MPFSSGTFSLYTPGNPVVTGTTISSTWCNNTLNDIATGLTTCLLKDGTQTVTANIPMSSFKLTGLAVGSTAGDSIRYEQVSNPNWLLVPGFNVTQQGTSFTSTTVPANNDDTYLLGDVWYLLSDGNDIVDITQYSTRADIADQASFGAQFDIETGNKKFAYCQIISAERTKALFQNATGRVSVGITVECSAVASFAEFRMYVLAWTGTADSVTSDVVSAWGAGSAQPTWIANITQESTSAAITPTTSPVRSTESNIALDTAGTNNLIIVLLSNDDSTTVGDFLRLSAPKLEFGTAATNYQERPYEAELNDVQFYFWRQTRANTGDQLGTGYCQDTTNAVIGIKLPRIMRSAPTFTVSAGTDFTIGHQASATDTTGIATSTLNTNLVQIVATVAAGLTAGEGASLRFDATAGGFIQMDSRL